MQTKLQNHPHPQPTAAVNAVKCRVAERSDVHALQHPNHAQIVKENYVSITIHLLRQIKRI